jgi:hypothetical protein
MKMKYLVDGIDSDELTLEIVFDDEFDAIAQASEMVQSGYRAVSVSEIYSGEIPEYIEQRQLTNKKIKALCS